MALYLYGEWQNVNVNCVLSIIKGHHHQLFACFEDKAVRHTFSGLIFFVEKNYVSKLS